MLSLIARSSSSNSLFSQPPAALTPQVSWMESSSHLPHSTAIIHSHLASSTGHWAIWGQGSCPAFLPSHQCRAEKMLSNVCLVNHAKRRENILELTPYPCLLPSGISSGDVSRCSWNSQLSKTKLEHPANYTFTNYLRGKKKKSLEVESYMAFGVTLNPCNHPK